MISRLVTPRCQPVDCGGSSRGAALRLAFEGFEESGLPTRRQTERAMRTGAIRTMVQARTSTSGCSGDGRTPPWGPASPTTAKKHAGAKNAAERSQARNVRIHRTALFRARFIGSSGGSATSGRQQHRPEPTRTEMLRGGGFSSDRIGKRGAIPEARRGRPVGRPDMQTRGREEHQLEGDVG